MDIPVFSPSEYTTLVFAAIVAIFSAARIARLLTHDHMPLFADLRDWWDRSTSPRWSLLLNCHYCAIVYVAPVLVLWAYWSDLHVTWWLFNGSLMVAYLGAHYVSRDGDDS